MKSFEDFGMKMVNGVVLISTVQPVLSKHLRDNKNLLA